MCCCVSGLRSSRETGKVVLNYAEGDSGTLSGHGMALRGISWMDMALGCAPRNALSGHMTTLYAHTLMHAHVRERTHTVGKEKGLHAREIDNKTKTKKKG